MRFNLAAHTIFIALAGSHAHGTARDGSDVDLRGVCIAPLDVRLSLFERFEQYDGPLVEELAGIALPRLRAHATASRGLDVKIECVVFDLAKFVGLCATANPNALEILFADERDWIYETPVWRKLHDGRHRFLSKQIAQTHVGYAMAQLKRIETHRSWLLHPPARKPTREDFGLPETGTLHRDDQNRIEEGIADQLRSYGVDDLDMPKPTRIAVQERLRVFWTDVFDTPENEIEERMRAVATHALALPTEVVTTLNAEKRYRAAMKHWESYQAWKAQRNPMRSALERQHGYDTKHAMHLIRLMRMGLEALQQGTFAVRRSDADELIAIREGALSFEQLLAAAKHLERELRGAAETTSLPAKADPDDIDRWFVEIVTLAG